MFYVKHRVPFVIPASDVSPGAGTLSRALYACCLPLDPEWRCATSGMTWSLFT